MKWTFDPSHTSAEFSAKHLMVSTVKGRFHSVTGSLDFDDAAPEHSSVEATIEAAALNSYDEKRDGHLRSPEFLDVEKYPNITFKSTKVEKKDATTYHVTGDLTIKDVTKPVTLDVEYNGTATPPWGGSKRAGFTATTAINRKDFGLNWNVALEAGGVLVGENVKISLEIEAIPVEVEAAVATA